MATLVEFGQPKGRDFILITADNRVSLFDCDINKRRHAYIEKQHLSHKYTCSAWNHGKKAELGELAVGCSDGVILIWDLARGVVARVIGDASKGLAEVRDVAFSSDGKSLYACSEGESFIKIYSVADGALQRTLKGNKKGSNKLAVNPKAQAIALAGSSLKLLAEGAEGAKTNKRKLDVHFTGGAKCLVFTQCGRYLMCCAHDSQEVLVFHLQHTSEEIANNSPMCVLSCEENIQKLVARSNKDQGTVDVLCVLEGGDCSLHRIHDKNTTISSKVSLEDGTEAIDAFFLGNLRRGDCKLQLAVKRTTSTDVHFIEVSLEDGQGGLVGEYNLKAESETSSGVAATVKKGGENDAKNAQSCPAVIGPLETGPTKRPMVEDEVVSENKKRRIEADNTEEQEMTMEARLKRLSTEMKLVENAGRDANPSSSSSSSSKTTPAPTSDSLVALLDQALQSGDDSLLEQCIGCEDPSVIEATAARLPTGRIVSFMKRLVSKFEKRPSRGILLTRWLSAVLNKHAAFLIAVPDVSQQLASLGTMLEQRLASYTKLAALGGRLDLLLAQVSGDGGGNDGQGPHVEMKPIKTLVVAEEDDDENN